MARLSSHTAVAAVLLVCLLGAMPASAAPAWFGNSALSARSAPVGPVQLTLRADQDTLEPTIEPTPEATFLPQETVSPSFEPIPSPSRTPTPSPSRKPTSTPSRKPTPAVTITNPVVIISA